ncbi:MAG: hypothetical protein QG599_2994 [Pseudomonadota bacterium]|nr:hypothetical protein [Pseudomonadota bacterium]
MRKIILSIGFIMAAGAGWYGHHLYRTQGLPFINESPGPLTEKKCITKDGKVIYGVVPEGTVCQKWEPVQGSLMVVPSKKPE